MQASDYGVPTPDFSTPRVTVDAKYAPVLLDAWVGSHLSDVEEATAALAEGEYARSNEALLRLEAVVNEMRRGSDQIMAATDPVVVSASGDSWKRVIEWLTDDGSVPERILAGEMLDQVGGRS